MNGFGMASPIGNRSVPIRKITPKFSRTTQPLPPNLRQSKEHLSLDFQRLADECISAVGRLASNDQFSILPIFRFEKCLSRSALYRGATIKFECPFPSLSLSLGDHPNGVFLTKTAKGQFVAKLGSGSV